MVKYMDNNAGFNQWLANKSAQKKSGGLTRFLWWVVLVLITWWLVGTFMGTKKTAVPADTTADVTTVDLSALPVATIANEYSQADARGLRITDVELNGFQRTATDDAPMRMLASDAGAFAEIGVLATGTTAPVADTVWNDASSNVQTWRNADGVTFTRAFEKDGYVITVGYSVQNNSTKDISVAPYARIVRGADKTSSAGVYTGAVAYANGDFEHKSWPSIAKHPRAYTAADGYVGFVDQYWETVVAIDSPNQTLRAAPHGDMYQADASAAAVVVPAGETRTIHTHLYVGPRERGALRGAADKIAGINKTMDYGWFWFLARPLAWALNMIHAVVMNYGVAIIILTLLLRLLMWPLTRKSYTSMAKMQKMQPEMARIQKLYANDKPRLQMEMMRLYQTHRTSPMSGCLPMLIQIPIFFALYKALLVSVQLRHAHFLWIKDLAAMDPYFILPVLMGATMFWQQHLQSAPQTAANANDPVAQTQRAMRWMPVLFTVLFAWMPAGLVLYWATSNLCGILQMYLIKRRS